MAHRCAEWKLDGADTCVENKISKCVTFDLLGVRVMQDLGVGRKGGVCRRAAQSDSG